MIKHLFHTEITDTEMTDIEGVGTLRYGSTGQVWRWIKNRSTTTAIVAKQPVSYNDGNVGTKAIFKSVNEPETENLMIAAGLAVTALAASATDALSYGWICVQGYFQDALLGGDTAIGLGDSLVGVNDANYLALATTDSTAPIYSSHYMALETVSSSSGNAAAKDVYVKCL